MLVHIYAMYCYNSYSQRAELMDLSVYLWIRLKVRRGLTSFPMADAGEDAPIFIPLETVSEPVCLFAQWVCSKRVTNSKRVCSKEWLTAKQGFALLLNPEWLNRKARFYIVFRCQGPLSSWGHLFQSPSQMLTAVYLLVCWEFGTREG